MCGPSSIETQQTYDEIAPEYARRSTANDAWLLEDLRSTTTGLPPGSVIADIGCGPGRAIETLRSQGFRVIGLDLSMGQLRTGGLPEVLQADMCHLPLRDESVDAVWCAAALLHIAREAVPAVLDEFARVIRIGGVLFLFVAEGDGEGWEVAENYGSSRRRWFTYHRLPDLRAFLSASGFEVHQIRRSRTHRDWLALNARKLPG